MTTPRRELRLALGMRGGVSLAVWIGGACAEVNELRLARRDAEQESFWADVLKTSNYTCVVVDVLAGASAGGLNAVLLATAIRYGSSLQGMRKMWLDLGGLDYLLRTRKPYLSVLDGDRTLLEDLRSELRKMAPPGIEPLEHPEPPADHPPLDLQLSATLVEPVSARAFTPPDEELRPPRFGARFHFRHDFQVSWGKRDFPARTEDGLDAALCQLAVAGRATASFPVAFEAAGVRARRRPGFSGTRAATAASGQGIVDLGGVFSERRGSPAKANDEPFGGDDFVVADGGIVDNIPLGKALDAIVVAPASGLTRRVLVYMQPGDPCGRSGTLASGEGGQHTRRSARSVGSAFVRTKLVSENIAGDTAQRERHNRSIAVAQALRRNTLVPGRGVLGVAEALWPAYGPQRAAADAARLRTLLDDPLAQLGDDPFPESGDDTDDRWRAPVSRWEAGSRQELDAALAVALGRRPLGDSWGDVESDEGWPILCAGVGPLQRVTLLLLEWVGHLQSVRAAQPEEIASLIRPEKAVLYRVLGFVTSILDRQRRMGWVVLAGDDPRGDVSAWADGAIQSLNRLLQVDPAPATAITRALGPDAESADAAAVTGYESDSLERIDALFTGADPVALRPGSIDLRQAILKEVVVPAAGRLLRLAALVGPPAPSDPISPGGLVAGALAASNAETVTPLHLAALEVATLSEHLAGSPGGRAIDFLRMSAAAESPLAPSFEALQEAAHWPASGHLPVEVKLAGNELFNFAAFLRREWRANDWMWGRLDAVPALVGEMVTPDSIRAWLGCAGPGTPALGEAVARVTDLVTTTSLGEEWRRFLLGRLNREELEQEIQMLMGAREQEPRALRHALTARRQWEIVACELGRDGRPLSPEDAEAAVRTYRVGAEGIVTPPRLALARTAARFGGVALRVLAASLAERRSKTARG